ncbi:MAG: hypothetical protein R3C56_36645 [Pirellulaceae bacterium]
MPNVGGLNFVVRGILRRALRNDAQGKALAQALLSMRLDDDRSLGESDGGASGHIKDMQSDGGASGHIKDMQSDGGASGHIKRQS